MLVSMGAAEDERTAVIKVVESLEETGATGIEAAAVEEATTTVAVEVTVGTTPALFPAGEPVGLTS